MQKKISINLLGVLVWLVVVSSPLVAQDMYKQLKSEHDRIRFGYGVQVLEPTGVTFQAFHGFFCSNSDSYATYAVWELGVGVENTVLTSEKVAYKGGVWKAGGFRTELNFLYPILFLEPSLAIQLYGGLGVQTGQRKYEIGSVTEAATATGYNLLARLEVSFHGKEVGQSILFLSIYLDAKYHRDFAEDFNYLKPSFGVRIRKAR